jgi:hypothetical protein
MSTRGLAVEAVNPTTPGHLALKKDDVVKVLSLHTSGYYFCEKGSGTQGWVKKASLILAKSFIPTANYTAGSDDELGLTSGTRVFGFTQEEEWWFGCSQSGKQGAMSGER